MTFLMTTQIELGQYEAALPIAGIPWRAGFLQEGIIRALGLPEDSWSRDWQENLVWRVRE